MQRSISTLILLYLASQTFPVSAEMRRVELAASFYRIDAEVASSQEDRSQGLMFREKMATNQGMVFVFPQADRHCMWMRNTLIPLSVAFLDEQGRILNIEDMQPKTETTHCASAPARFALEMNIGWFAQKGLKPGLRIGGIKHLSVQQ